MVTKELKSANAASRMEFGEVRCAGVDFDVHVTLFILDSVICMSGVTVERLGYIFHCFIGSLCLFGDNVAEGGKHIDVDGAFILDEFDDNALDFVDTCFVERG